MAHSSLSGSPRRLYLQVLFGIAIGILFGVLAPSDAAAMKPLGDAFVKLIKMMITPIVFVTVVVGIARMGDLKEVGRVGLKALVYFELLTTVALVLGLIVVNVLQPGSALHANVSTLDASAVASYTAEAKALSPTDLMLHFIPDSVVGAFVSNEIIQVLLFSILFGLATASLGKSGVAVIEALEKLSAVLFGIVGIILRFAPVGAFGAMAFTIGKYGAGSLVSLGKLMMCVYATCLIFIFVVLGTVARITGFSLWAFLKYIREELLIVLGTSSSEAALPPIMAKLEAAGCAKPVVGLVIPAGYSFNLDGTSIYLTMAVVFIAQATGVPLSLGDQLGILAVLLLTSKGAAAVTGSGFITLAATLSVTGKVPVAGLVLLLGIDRFMSEARALTNLVGNGVATIVVAAWESALDREKLAAALKSSGSPESR